jgi:hypothetical protein
MYANSSGRSRWRAGALAVALAGVTVLAAACGGDPVDPKGPSPDYQSVLAYAACMRSHGEPQFPSPVRDGSRVSIQIARAATVTPQYRSARGDCKHLIGQ